MLHAVFVEINCDLSGTAPSYSRQMGKSRKNITYTSHTRLAPYRKNGLTEKSSACSFVMHKVIGKNIVLVCTAAGSVISIQV